METLFENSELRRKYQNFGKFDFKRIDTGEKVENMSMES